MATLAAAPALDEPVTPLNRVVTGAAVGTIIEYYDFGIYSALALALAANFFPPDNPQLGILLAVASTGIAFLVRPLGGMLFGVMSDKIGRKYTFMATLFMMSLATILMGVTPSYATIGFAAPLIIVGLRIMQGLAVGGEYAAASTYVVEHAPDARRGYYTGWLGAMTSGSLLLSLLAVSGTSKWMGRAAFDDWGWRLPFLYAVGMLVIALLVRAQLHESPVFVHLKKKMGTPKTPLRDVLTNRANLGLTLAVAFGICAPQITAGLGGSMLALYFMQTVGKVDPGSATLLIAAGCAVGVPLTVWFGAQSDRFGRKPVQITGMILGALLFLPLFKALVGAAVIGSPLAYCWICLLQIPSAMIVGPGFAAMTEAFPASRRSTSVALAFSAGGVIGGFAPAASLWLSQQFGNPFWGVAWPIAILLIGALINWRWVPEQSGRKIWDDVLA